MILGLSRLRRALLQLSSPQGRKGITCNRIGPRVPCPLRPACGNPGALGKLAEKTGRLPLRLALCAMSVGIGLELAKYT